MKKMNFEQLWKAMEKANDEGQELKGYIVFSSENFTKNYDTIERTYQISSNNNAFNSGKISNAIYGTCLDMTETIRIDYALDAWVIEYCYI